MGKFKKVFAIFVSVILFAVCGFLTGCGNKYKNLKWEISYSLTQEGEMQWVKLDNNNLNLNFGQGGNILADEDGSIHCNLYIKAKINGVKGNHLGQIIVTNTGSGNNSGGALSISRTINNNEYITIRLDLSKEENISTQLNFREINSGKNTNVNLSVSPLLSSMSMDVNKLTPAVLGASVQLDASKSILFSPIGTTDRDVQFSFDGVVGSYTSRYDLATGGNELSEDEFTRDSTTDTSKITVSPTGLVTIPADYQLTKNNYVVRVKATSISNPSMSCYVDVYVVDGKNKQIALNFNNSTATPVQDEFSLYLTLTKTASANSGENSEAVSLFNKAELVLNNDEISNDIYFKGLQTKNRNIRAKYTPEVYISGKNRDASPVASGEIKEGLKVSNTDNLYVVEAVDPNVDFSADRYLNFKYVLEGFEYSDLLPTFASEDIKVNLSYLANAIEANNLTDLDPSTPELDTIIYNTQDTILTSFDVSPKMAKYNFSEDNKILIEPLLDSSSNGTLTFNGQADLAVEQNEQVKIALNGSSARFKVSVRCVPEVFAGEEVDSTYVNIKKEVSLIVNVQKVVTASKVEAYANQQTRWSSSELDGAINLNFDDIKSVYLKVYFDADDAQNFVPSSVALNVANNAIQFVTDSGERVSNINLSQLIPIARKPVGEAGQNYFWYKIDLETSGATVYDTFNIGVKAGDGRVNLSSDSDANFTIRYVTPSNGNFRVLTDNTNNNILIEDNNLSSTAYAVAITGNSANFSLVDSLNSATGIKEIKVVPSRSVPLSNSQFSGNAEILPNTYSATNTFSFNPKGEYTQILDVYVHYYAKDNGIIKLIKNYVDLQEQPTLTVQLAAFRRATKINITKITDTNDADTNLDNLRVAYFEGFPQAGELKLNISTDENVKNEVYFLAANGEVITKTGVNNLAVRLGQNEAIASGQNSYYDQAVNLQIDPSQNGKIVTFNLSKQYSAELFRLNIGTLTLGQFSDNKELLVRVVGFSKTTQIALDADGLENNNIYTSFIDGKDIQFDITAIVSWAQILNNNLTNGKLGYQLYKYLQNPDGSLSYKDGKAECYQIEDLEGISIDDFTYQPQQSSTSLTAKTKFTATYTGTNLLGGVYKLIIGTLDSYSELNGYTTYQEITIFIGDGSIANKFSISSQQDFEKINNNLSAHYVLTEDITLNEEFVPIGFAANQIEIFTGSLTGRNVMYVDGREFVEQHSITLTLNMANARQYNGEYLLGLFAYLGTNTTDSAIDNVTNIQLELNFTGNFSSEASAVVGGVAAINRGRISAVDITLNNQISFAGLNNLTFGGYVGRNFGRVDVKNAKISNESTNVNIDVSNSSFGLIAGEMSNDAEIVGNFDSNKFMNLAYNVAANIVVNLAENSTLDFGLAAGKVQSGKIANLAVGGNVSINGVSATAYVGLVGSAQNARVSYSAVVSANITNNASSGSVAGIVANSLGGNTINNCKVMFDLLGARGEDNLSKFTSTSQQVLIAGVLVANTAVQDTIIYVSVENISSSNKLAIDGAGEVAGLVLNSGNTNLSVSFAAINMSGSTIYPISNTSEENCYYIGQVESYEKFTKNDKAVNSYAVVVLGDKLYSVYQQKEYKVEEIDFSQFFNEEPLTKWDIDDGEFYSHNYYDSEYNKVDDYSSLQDDQQYYELKEEWDANVDYYGSNGTVDTYYSIGEFSNEFSYYSLSSFVNDLYEAILPNVIQDSTIENQFTNIWGLGQHNQIDLGEFSFNLPYLKYDGKALNVDRTQSFYVSAISQNKQQVSHVQKTDSGYVAIINYHSLGSIPQDAALDVDNKFNTYNIINNGSNNGLITIVGAGNVSLSFEIVSGGQFAEIVNYTQIKFTGVSGALPICLRIYSTLTNSHEDVIFYTQYGATDVSVTDNVSNSVETLTGLGGALEYGVNVYVTNSSKNDSDISLQINAQNRVGLNSFNSILQNLNVEVQNNISLNLVCLESDKQDYLTYRQSGQSVVISPNKDVLSQVESSRVEVRYLLKLEFVKNYYTQNNADFNGENINYGQVYITFTIYQAATEIYSSNTSYEIGVGTTAKIDTTLITTRTGGLSSDVPLNFVKGEINPNHLIVQDDKADSLYIDFELVEGEDVFNAIKNYTGISSITDWFDNYNGILISKSVKEDGKIEYSISLTVKNEFNFRRITSNIKLKIKMYAQSNQQISNEILLTVKPEQLNENKIQINAYKIRQNQIIDNNGHAIVIESNETESVQSGTAGGLLVISLQPSYTNIDFSDIRLTSERVGETYIQFEQMILDRQTGQYITYINNNDILDGDIIVGKRLAPYSERVLEDGEYKFIYTGTFYVRMYLSKFVVQGQQVGINLDVNKINEDNSLEPVNLHKNLYTEFVANVIPTYEGGYEVGSNGYEWVIDGETSEQYNSYLIQKNSTNNVVKLRIYGYEYNSQPTISFNKLIKTQNNFEYTLGDTIDIGYRFNTNFGVPPVKESDGAYVIEIVLSVGDIDTPFIINTNLNVSLDGVGHFTNNKIIFHPTDHIIQDIRLDEVVNGEFRINLGSSRAVNISFETKNGSGNVALNDIFREDLQDIINLYTINNGEYLNPEADYTIFDINKAQTENSKALVLRAKTPGNVAFKFELDYYYEMQDNGCFNVHFGTKAGDTIYPYSKRIDFTLVVNDAYSSETAPIAIRNEAEFLAINGTTSESNYILMADLTLENYPTITANFNSFDGNNHIITIKSFSSDQLASYGLFSTIGSAEEGRTTTLKNIIVSYQDVNLNLTDNETALTSTENGVVFGGLVANLNEGGIIYNCDVMNVSLTEAATLNSINITMPNNPNAKITFGGMVGINNNGIITNSRVGAEEYLQIRESNGVILEKPYETEVVTFNIGNTNADTNQFIGITGGFVGVNAGRIASSFVQRTNLYNYSKAETSQTAGFVAQNGIAGLISYSYVKSLPVTNIKELSLGTAIENKSSGNVAGFVHLNMGEVSNCYANVEVKSKSTFISGFVFRNDSTGYIHECYAAATLNGNRADAGTQNNISEQPFVGYKNGDVQSYGKMENVYFYNNSSNIHQVTQTERPIAVDLNKANIQNPKYLHGFAFVMSDNSIRERNQGVWSYYEYDTNNTRVLPEINTANNIAHSYRYYDENSQLVYAFKYNLGSSNNPDIIRNITDYNEVFGGNDDSGNARNFYTGHVRFINDLDFENIYIPITSKNYTLGSDEEIASIEGNGMKIKNVRFSTNAHETTNEIGLFANIKNSYIKNLTITLGNEPSVGNTKYLGALAGKVEDSVLINIDIDGANIKLEGSNFVGGLAGIITGSSLIYGVSSNVSVVADVNKGADANIYYNRADFDAMKQQGYFARVSYEEYLDNADRTSSDGLSYAGGIAGVIDLVRRGQEEFNMQFITINKPQSAYDSGVNYSQVIDADFAGGVAGYFGGGDKDNVIKAKKIKFYTLTSNAEGETGSQIVGGNTAGGLFAISNGHIEASQVTSVEKEIDAEALYNQYDIDTAFAKHVTNTEQALDKTAAGNLNLISGKSYAGGLVGISLNANLTSVYAKAGFDLSKATNSTVVGGLVGLSIGGQVSYSYAVPFINKTANNITLGGLIGRVYNYNIETDVNNIANAKEKQAYIYTTNVFNNTSEFIAQYTFSTLIKEKSTTVESENIRYFIADSNAKETYKVDGSNLISVYVGTNYTFDSIVQDADISNANEYGERDLTDLYNTSIDAVFNEIFESYSQTSYWSLNNNRYFPLLLDERASNRIEIWDESDLPSIKANPDGDFAIKKDFSITAKDANYVLPITFTGSIISETLSGATATITIQGLNPNVNGNAGFFRETNGAYIENIIFNWQPQEDNTSDNPASVDIGKNGAITIDYFGGVSAVDTGSTFRALQVVSKAANTSITGQILKTSNDSSSIAKFGGLIGIGTDSRVQSCLFDAKLNANVKGFGVDSTVAFGALAAEAMGSSSITDNRSESSSQGMAEEEDGDLNKNLSISGFNVSNETSFTLYSANNQNETVSNAYIGFVVGYVQGNAENSFISSLTIGESSSANTSKPTINIGQNNNFNVNTLNVGAVAGRLDQLLEVSNARVVADINYNCKPISTLQPIINIGGVVGSVSSCAISEVVSQVNINVKPTNNSNCAAKLSNGFALAGNVTISECSFMGEIDATQGENTSDIRNIVAAGVIAEAEYTVNINDVFAYPIINAGTSTTESLHLAGLIANNNSKLNASGIMLGGRLMVDNSNINPSGNEEANTDNSLYIGGIIANGYKKNVTISNAEVLTSILTDGLKNSDAQYLQNVNALFGGNMGTINGNIVYSSDFALVAENLDGDKDKIFNLTARNITSANNNWLDYWQGDTSSFARAANGAPYLSTISRQLNSLGILAGNQYTNNANATQFSPQQYSNTDDYRYYLVSESLPAIEGAFKGVLIGTEEIALTDTINLTNLEGQDEAGIIPIVEKHSAISNIHILVQTDISSDANIKGILVGLNQGVVSNCSVGGTNINLATTGILAGLVGRNTGTMQYCYSSAEYVSISASEFAGLVYANNGKLAYSYFTGYIENQSTAYGILGNNGQAQNEDRGYLFSNYMAGVVVNVSPNANSFGNYGNNYYGKFNYIDANANSEQITRQEISSDPNTDSGVAIVDTINIMAANKYTTADQCLQGIWHTIVQQTTGSGDAIHYQLNSQAATFGYNYGYPVYRFNKVSGVSSSVIDDNKWQLYTGDGKWQKAGASDGDTQERANNLFNKTMYNDMYTMYDNAYKIPHLGVLKSVNLIANDNLNFVFIYNIDGKIKNSSNTAYATAGSIGSDVCGGFTNDAKQFTGVVVSNKYYNFTDLNSGDSDVIISNISTNGLFTNVKNSYFGNIKFAGNFNLLNGTSAAGVLISSTAAIENDQNNEQNNISINNINFVSNNETNVTEITINSSDRETETSAAALIGLVNTSTTVTIGNFGIIEGCNLIISGSSGESDTSTNYAGLVAGQNKGTITFYSGFDNLKVAFNSCNYAGGLIGLNNGGTLTLDSSNNNKLTITSAATGGQSPLPTKYLGGIYGKINGGGISGTSINVVIGDGSSISAKNLGGIAAEVNNEGNKTFTVSNIISINATETSSTTIINNEHFGGIAATFRGKIEFTKDAAFNLGNTSAQFEVYKSNETKGYDDTNSGVGGLFGRMAEANATIHLGVYNISLVATTNGEQIGKANVGGLVGFATGENVLSITGLSDEGNITVAGMQNVGGLFGRVDQLVRAKDNPSSDGQTSQEDDGLINYYNIDEDKLNITVNISEYQHNIGGLIGYYENNNNEKIGTIQETNDGATTEKADNITSNATLNFVSNITANNENTFSYNIGGVFGQIAKAGKVSNLTYSGQFKGVSDPNNTLISFDESIQADNDKTTMFRTINVGGVIGSAGTTVTDNAQSVETFDITNITTTTQQIIGYQNVGGLIGYAVNVNIYNTNDLFAESDQTIKANNSANVYGVINVGGLVGMAENSMVGAYAELQEISTEGGTENQLVLKGYGLATSGSVYGNYNVGGLVGFAAKTLNISNPSGVYANTILSTETSTPESKKFAVEIKGLPYCVSYYIYDNGGQETYTYYIPSNIGGLVGFAHSVAIDSNKFNMAQGSLAAVTSSEEGTNSNNDNGVVISTISNYVGSVLNGDNIAEAYLGRNLSNDSTTANASKGVFFKNDYGNQAADFKVEFKDMKSGFGGLAGGVVKLQSPIGKEQGNTLGNVSIEAQLGINVGALYGFVGNSDSYNFNAIVKSATISGNISVDGGYFIGAIAGSVDVGQSIQDDDGSAFSNENIKAADGQSASITLQSKYTGMYVGGLFGKLHAHDNDMLSMVSSNVNITIDTSKSYYMGGLVGMYYVTGDTANPSVKLTGNVDKEAVVTLTKKGVKDPASIGEFGGFVGMLKVEKTTGGSADVTISNGGSQPYAFTINTIENGNYYDGPSKTEAQNSNEGVNLVAMATYVNQDRFTICPTSNSSWYTLPGRDGFSGNNPLKPSASTGWAKDYTMFKTMQRCIPAGKNTNNQQQIRSGTEEWDAISVVYDAANITYVATQSNSGYTLNPYDDGTNLKAKYYHDEDVRTTLFGENTEKSETTTTLEGADYIICTIYEAVDGQPMLYSKIGIAEPYKDENGNYGEPEDISKNGFKMFLYAMGMSSNVPESIANLDFSSTEWGIVTLAPLPDRYYGGILAMDSVDPNQGYYKINKSLADRFATEDASSSLVTYNYNIKNYYRYNSGSDDSDDSDLSKNTPTWFQFKMFYESEKLGGTDYTPNDGSIFNVTGMTTDNVQNKLYNKGNSYKGLKWIGIIVDAVLTVATLGVGSGFMAAKAAGQLVAKQIAKYIAKAVLRYGIRTAIALGVLHPLINQALAQQTASNTYYDVQDQTMGFLGMSYQREVSYRDGKMNTAIDGGNYIDPKTGAQYIYYSSVRPSDYYTNFYYVYYDYDPTKPEGQQVQTSIVEFNDENLIFEEDNYYTRSGGIFEGAMPCKYNGQDAACYYYYLINNGAYYVLMDATTIDYIPVQPFFEENEYKPYLDYINQINYYIRGSYNGTTYTIGESNDMNSYLYYADNTNTTIMRKNSTEGGSEITLPKSIKFEERTELHYVPVDQSYLFGEGNEDGLYKNLDNTNKVLEDTGKDHKDLNYGYGYMKNAYYTANGDKTYINNSGAVVEINSYSSIRPLVGKFVEGPTSGNEGIDYVTINVDGNTRSFVFDSVTTEAGTDIGELKGTNIIEDASGDYINVNLYPKSFTNPYSVQGGETTKDEDIYYILSTAISQNLTDSTGQPIGLSHNATYFYFDGGYKSDADGRVFTELFIGDKTQNNSIKIDVQKDDSPGLGGTVVQPSAQPKPYYSLYSNKDLRLLTDDGNGNEINDAYRPIRIYGPCSDDLEKLTFEDFVNGYETTYKGYYMLSDTELNGISENVKSMYLVSNYYKIYDAEPLKYPDDSGIVCDSNEKPITKRIYIINNYNIINDDINILTSVNIKLPNTGDGNISYNYNKYCLSADKNIYTRYYYTTLQDGNEIKIPTSDGNESYWLYKPNSTWPNAGTTNFVESVRVILGGGDIFYDKDDLNGNHSIGTISCQ